MLKDFEDPKSQNFEDFRKFENHGIFKFQKFEKSQNFKISKFSRDHVVNISGMRNRLETRQSASEHLKFRKPVLWFRWTATERHFVPMKGRSPNITTESHYEISLPNFESGNFRNSVMQTGDVSVDSAALKRVLQRCCVLGGMVLRRLGVGGGLCCASTRL